MEDRIEDEKNSISSIIKFLAILIIFVGFIISCLNQVMLNPNIQFEQMLIQSLMSSLNNSVIALLLYGFGEMIQIFHDIRRKMYEKK